MELFKSLENKTKSFSDPFDHFEINEPLTESAIKEISEASKFWAFEFEAIGSLTNKDSRIIMIKNVIRK